MQLTLSKDNKMSSNSISKIRYNFPCKCSNHSEQPMQLHSEV